MKNIIVKRLALALAAMLLLSFAAAVAVGEVAIDAARFPDEQFRAFVMAEVDVDGNGVLSDAEIAAATELWIDQYTYDAESLQGIEVFTALTRLTISNDNYIDTDSLGDLNSLDLSKNTALKHLSINRSELSALNLGKNTNLKTLDVVETRIAKLDLSKNTKLTRVYLLNNDKLASVNLSKNVNLTDVDLSWNKSLATLKLGKHKQLASFSCQGTKLAKLDLSKYTALTDVFVSGNKKLKTLKLGSLKKLVRLDCTGTKLAKLDIGGCKKLLSHVKSKKVKSATGKSYVWSKGASLYIAIGTSTTLYNGSKEIKIKK